MAKNAKQGALAGKLFVFTGYFVFRGWHVARKHVAEIIRKHGGKTVENLANSRKLPKGTSYLVIGDWNNQIKDVKSSKFGKADTLGIEKVDSEELVRMLGGGGESEIMRLAYKKAA